MRTGMPGRGDLSGGRSPRQVGALREDQLRLRRRNGRDQPARRRVRDRAQRAEPTARPAVASVAQTAADTLAERLGGAALGAYELLTVYLGHRLGLYRALAEGDDATPAELAEASGTNERYAREWRRAQPAGRGRPRHDA